MRNMDNSTHDGVALLSEMTDDPVLKSNLFPQQLAGREQVSNAVRAVEAQYDDLNITWRCRESLREFMHYTAVLKSGEKIEGFTVAVRDRNGWICAIHMDHRPAKTAKILAAQVTAAI